MTVRETLFEWLSARPAWQQDLAGRLASEAQLEGDAFNDALEMVLGAHGALADGDPAPVPQTLQLDDLPAAATTDDAPRLVSFGRLRGLGMAAPDQELRFAETGLTAIYGPNAAGKTTYVRGLKRVCRTVDRDAAVRGNVFTAPGAGASAPSANVEYFVGGERRAQQIDLTSPPDLGLSDISVFDSRCAELYIDARNAVAYIPSALMLLARLAATQDQMRSNLTTEIARLRALAPVFPELAQSSAAQNRAINLSAVTDLEELVVFATLAEEERTRQAELRAVIAAAETHSAHADAQAARRDGTEAEALVGLLGDLAARVAGPAVQALRAFAVQDKHAREAVELAAKEFDGLAVAGVGGEPWQHLWRAARDFNEQRHAVFPPEAGDPCPLCLQEIDGEAAGRMAHFQQHIESSLQADAEAARLAMSSALERLGDSHVAACRTPFLDGLKEREAGLHEALERYVTDVGAQMNVLLGDPAGADVLPVVDGAVKQLAAWGRARAEHAAVLLAAEDPKREAELRTEIVGLDGREKLASRLADVTAWVATLGHIAALSDAYTALATNRITTRQRELADEMVTETLSGGLREELSNLGCEHLPVDLQPQTAVGETQVLLRLAGAHGAPRVSEILSEGEQRAVSLAFFLAEVSSSENDGGIIVDDPVSSLDDERRAYIARRLVEESARRQVVVLTHDLAFLLDLSDHAEAAGAEALIQGVWRTNTEVGRVDDHPPFTAMKLRSRIGVLDQQVAQWDNQPAPRDFDEAWRRVCDLYDQMRKTWERAIEERLFRGVVQRLQREVKTRKLKDVAISPEQIGTVTEGMTRCSHFVHDAPPGTATNLPDRQQLAKDLERLKDFERDTRTRT